MCLLLFVIGLSLCELSFQFVGMSFTVNTFVADPKLTVLTTLKRLELVVLANLDMNSGMRKGDVQKLVSDYLIHENIVSDEEIVEDGDSTIELKKVELQEKEKEHETQELKCEIAVQLKVKELELVATTTTVR